MWGTYSTTHASGDGAHLAHLCVTLTKCRVITWGNTITTAGDARPVWCRRSSALSYRSINAQVVLKQVYVLNEPCITRWTVSPLLHEHTWHLYLWCVSCVGQLWPWLRCRVSYEYDEWTAWSGLARCLLTQVNYLSLFTPGLHALSHCRGNKCTQCDCRNVVFSWWAWNCTLTFTEHTSCLPTSNGIQAHPVLAQYLHEGDYIDTFSFLLCPRWDEWQYFWQ